MDWGLLYFDVELWVIKKKLTIMMQARIVHEVILGKEVFGVCRNVKLFKVGKNVIFDIRLNIISIFLCEQAEFHTCYWLSLRCLDTI